jgi:hypothetical protein
VGSGLIYAVIVVLWAVVLVPMWMRRHDTETEVRSVDRFSNAMGTLSRRASKDKGAETADGSQEFAAERFDGAVVAADEITARESVVATPQAPAPGLTTLSFGPRPRPEEQAADVFVSRPRSAERRSAQADRLRRRRRVLLSLGVLLVVTGVLAGVGLVAVWAPGAALLLSAGYLVMLRRYALADARERREQLRQVTRTSSARVDLTPPVERATQNQPTVVLERATASSTDQAPVADAAVEGAWSPQSMPLPTYVTAPAATAVPRVIDRAEADGWTAQRMVERAEAARLASGIDASPADDAVWAEATSRDDVFDREFFEAGVARDGFAEVVEDEVELIVGDRPRRRHPSHDEADLRRASGA